MLSITHGRNDIRKLLGVEPKTNLEERTIMTEHRLFRISDFSLRDVPWAIAAYLIISLFSISLGIFLESLSEFWSGLLLGAGCATLVSYILLQLEKREVEVAAFPRPSASVMAKCDDPACSLVEAVKAYREETGLGLSEAAAVLRNYQASNLQKEKT